MPVARHALFVLAGALLALSSVPESAQAHAVLLESVPADASKLDQAPAEVVLRFNEPVMAVALRVLDAQGRNVALAAQSQGEVLRAGLPAGLPAGKYVVSYRVLSADSHPVAASLVFAVGETDAAPAAVLPAEEVRWGLLAIANRAVHLASLAIAAGGALFLLFVGAPGAGRNRLLLGACLLGALTAILAIGLEGAAAANAGGGDLLRSEIWRLGLAASRGTASLAVLGGLAAIAAGRRLLGRGGIGSALPLAGVALVLSGFVLSGHAATALPHWFAMPMWLLHTGVAMLWIGSLPPLLSALHRAPDSATPQVRRFSALAAIAVPLLLGAGLCMALVEGGPMLFFEQTRYAGVLGVKLSLVAILLGLAVYNRLALLPRLDSAVSAVRRRLAWSIRAELAVALAVLGCAATLSHQVPPRALAAAKPVAQGVSELVLRSAGGRRAGLRVLAGGPPVSGIQIQFMDEAGRPLQPQEVMLELSNREAAIEPLPRRLERLGTGLYRVRPDAFPLSGRWQLRIEALISDFDAASFAAEVLNGAGMLSLVPAATSEEGPGEENSSR